MIRFDPEQPRRARLRRGEALTLRQLDQLLDVRVGDFERTVSRLIKEFKTKQITLDLPVGSARIPPQPLDSRVSWVRLYEAQVHQLEPMDRAEEFRMARRYDFIKARVQSALREAGVSEEDLAKTVQRGSNALNDHAPSVKPAVRANLERALRDYEALRNLYAEGALYMVLGCVQRYRNLGVDIADLIQEGNTSLFQAMDGFDWRRDVRFKTYAQYWIHQAMLKVLYNTSRTVRLPVWVQKSLAKIRKVRDAERQSSGAEPPDEVVGSRLGLTGDRVRELLNVRRYTMSLDAEVNGDEGASLAQLLPDDRIEPVADSLDDGDLSACLEEIMADLPSREHMILTRRFGLHGGEPETLSEIAEDLGITAERVRQLQKAALGRLQRPSKVKRLRAYAG